MDEYKISQNPGDPKSADAKGKAKKPKSTLRNRHASRLLSPQLVLGGVVGALLLVFVGVFAATHLADKLPLPASLKPGTKKAAPKPSDHGVVTGNTFNDVTNAIAGKHTANLQHYYAPVVRVVVPSRTVNQNVDGSRVDSLISDMLNNATTPWNWHVSASQLSAWQNGPYGQYFTGNVVVGISNDGTVISLTFNDAGQITTVFIAPVGDLTAPVTSTGGTTGSGTTDSTSTTPTSPGVTNGGNDSD